MASQAKRVPRHSPGCFLYPDLIDRLDPKDPLLLLGKAIPWEHFEAEFAPLYANCGRPAKPIRLMRELRDLLRVIRFQRKKSPKVRNAAFRRAKTIANALLRELERKLSAEAKEGLAHELENYTRTVNQKRKDKLTLKPACAQLRFRLKSGKFNQQ